MEFIKGFMHMLSCSSYMGGKVDVADIVCLTL